MRTIKWALSDSGLDKRRINVGICQQSTLCVPYIVKLSGLSFMAVQFLLRVQSEQNIVLISASNWDDATWCKILEFTSHRVQKFNCETEKFPPTRRNLKELVWNWPGLGWERLRTAKKLFLLGSSDTDPIKVFPCEPLTFQKTMRNFMFVLLNLCTFCVISCADGAQLVTYCVRFYTNVEINSQELFVGLIPFHII